MLFNVNKCKVMHIGKQNQQRQYFMHDQCLEVVCQEKVKYYQIPWSKHCCWS